MLINLTNAFINWIISLFYIPTAWFSPPKNTEVYFWHKHGLLIKGTWNGSNFEGGFLSAQKQAKYKTTDILCWSFRNLVCIEPKQKIQQHNNISLQIVSARSTKQVWDYIDPLGKKMHVTYDQRKGLEKDKFFTSVGNKRELIEKQAEKKLRRENEEHYRLHGTYKHNF